LGRSPSLGLLRCLTFPTVDYEASGFEELDRFPLLPNLQSFVLGSEDRSCVGEDAAGSLLPATDLLRKMPRLKELRLYARDLAADEIFGLPFPHLKVLYVYHLHDYPLEYLADNSTLGNLERLALWPHGLEYDDEAAYITFEGVRALVHSPHLKKLTHLQLRLTDLGDEGCAEIVRSGILRRLKTLDITGGRVTDAGARVLAACPDLKHLERLEIVNNWLTPAGVAALQAVGINVEAKEQLNPDSEEREYLFYGDCE
jgi:hypothetical protein